MKILRELSSYCAMSEMCSTPPLKLVQYESSLSQQNVQFANYLNNSLLVNSNYGFDDTYMFNEVYFFNW